MTEGEDALGEVTVMVRAHGRLASGQGVATDILEASARAYIRALSNALEGAAVREAEGAHRRGGERAGDARALVDDHKGGGTVVTGGHSPRGLIRSTTRQRRLTSSSHPQDKEVIECPNSSRFSGSSLPLKPTPT